MKKLLLLILLISIACANVYLISPLEKTVEEIDHSDYELHITYLRDAHLGKIGPGQALDLVFLRNADENFKWNGLEILECSYECTTDTTEETITVSTQIPIGEPEGLKRVTLKFKNDLNLRTPEIVSFTFMITKESLYVFEVPEDLEVIAGESQKVWFHLQSNSISTDELILGDFEGFPAAWSHSGTIQIKPDEKKALNFDITALDEGFYPIKFQLTSTSGAVLGQQEVTLRVLPSLKSKFIIYSEGFAFIPALLQPFYSLLSWLSLAF